MTINHFTFSDVDYEPNFQRKPKGLPKQVLNYLNPLDGKNFFTSNYHESWHHHIKVVSTMSTRDEILYQFSSQHQLTKVNDTEVPQVRFFYDIEPFSIQITKENKRWYDFGTVTLAILGGTFAVMRLLSKVSLATLMALRDRVDRSATSRRQGYLDEGYLN